MTDAYRESLIILPTVRCRYRCKFCAYHNDCANITDKIPSVPFLARETEKRMQARASAIRKNNEVYIVNSGSFLDERKIPKEYNIWLADFLSGKNLRLILECRADSSLNHYKSDILRLRNVTKSLTFGIGVEAYREDMGNETFRRLAKGITSEQCVEQAQKLHEYQCNVKSYCLIAPPWLGGLSFLREGYRRSMDWLIETAFLTAKFAARNMKSDILGISPFFPYRGTNAPIPEDWMPVSATESAEVANQLRQVLSGIRIDYTSRQIHLAFGNFFRLRGLKKPVDARNSEQVLETRENVAEICRKVFGVRGNISRQTASQRR
jgi:hypothetical protein